MRSCGLSIIACILLSAAATAVAACAGGAPSPCSPTQVVKNGQVPSVQASPATAAIVGILTDGHTPRPGEPAHIRWLVDARRGASQMQIIAGRQDVNKSFQVTVPRARVSGDRAEYDSTLLFPSSGCWNVQASTGPAQATVTFEVQPAKPND